MRLNNGCAVHFTNTEQAGAAGKLARVQYDLARMLIAAGQPAEAKELLDIAITAFEDLGYRPLLVQRHVD